MIEGALILSVCAVLVVCALASRSASAEGPATTRLTVASGDTLWAIAASHPIAGLTTAQTADSIARLNGVSASDLTPGTVLDVPATATKPRLAKK